MKIIPIVEGDGEIEAAPLLLRRFIALCNRYELTIGKAIKRKRSQLVSKEGLATAIQLAKLDPDCGAILILFDADDDCPRVLAPVITAWAKEASLEIPCEIVIANREYEAWFLSAINSLKGHCSITADALRPGSPETIRGAKEKLESFMPRNRGYTEKLDQPTLTAHFSLKEAFVVARSFRRMVRAFGLLAANLLGDLEKWPPEDWTAEIDG